MKIQLSWENKEEIDLDAHLLQQGGIFPPSDPYSDGYDFGDNCWQNRNPDWGRSDVTFDNPFLDMDSPGDAETGKETITIIEPNDQDYTFKVHNAWGYVWDDHGYYVPSQTKATVKVWVGGKLRASYKKTLGPDEVWTPFEISNLGKVTPVGSVETTEWQKLLPS